MARRTRAGNTRKPLTLGTVPVQEWDAIGSYGFDAVWLMGVWERSPAGIAVSMKNESLLADFRRALPDFSQGQCRLAVLRAALCVDPHLGGPDGMAGARQALARRGMRLILDFVPNHVAPDHPWVAEHAGVFHPGRCR